MSTGPHIPVCGHGWPRHVTPYALWPWWSDIRLRGPVDIYSMVASHRLYRFCPSWQQNLFNLFIYQCSYSTGRFRSLPFEQFFRFLLIFIRVDTSVRTETFNPNCSHDCGPLCSYQSRDYLTTLLERNRPVEYVHYLLLKVYNFDQVHNIEYWIRSR